MREKLQSLIPVAAASGIAISYGITHLIGAVYTLVLVWQGKSHLSPQVGIETFNLLLGFAFALCGFGLIARQEWARRTLPVGSVAVAFYELGLRLQLSSIHSRVMSFEDWLTSASSVIIILLIVPLVTSKFSKRYVAEDIFRQ